MRIYINFEISVILCDIPVMSVPPIYHVSDIGVITFSLPSGEVVWWSGGKECQKKCQDKLNFLMPFHFLHSSPPLPTLILSPHMKKSGDYF